MFEHKLITLTALFGLLFTTACSVVGGKAAPEPKFRTILEQAPFEIRAYDELVVVKTPNTDGSNDAFGRLFDYISGKNSGEREIAMTAPVLNTPTKGEKIAMTAPVLQRRDRGQKSEMMFILTDNFTLQTAPRPSDPNVTLSTLPSRHMAVVRYSGSMTKGANKNETMLRDWIEEQGLTPIGPSEVAGYNPPWTLPPYRRNEVLIPISPKN